MTNSIIARLVLVAILAGTAAGCANTIRGLGQDTANTVDATQSAGRNVAEAAE